MLYFYNTKFKLLITKIYKNISYLDIKLIFKDILMLKTDNAEK